MYELADRPDFLWGEPLTRDDLKKLLAGENEGERLCYAAQTLREARFDDVWDCLSPAFLAAHREKLRNVIVPRGPEMALSAKDILSALQAEIKDYIDLYFLERAGYPLESYIKLARQKDARVSPAMLAYLLPEVRPSKVPEFMMVPVYVNDGQEYFQSLGRKLAVGSFPR